MKVIVIKKKDSITICRDGKKLIIDKNNKLFNKYNNLSIEEIKKCIRRVY